MTIFKKIIKLFLIALGFLPAVLLRFLNIRFLPVHTQRIGHLALEPDCYLKEERLGLHPRFKLILCAPRCSVANQSLSEYWGKHLFIINSSWICFALKPLSLQKILRYEVDRYAVAINKTAAFGLIQQQWGERPPLLSLSQEHRKAGERLLREMGVPTGAWFVCVHSREGAYSPHDEHLHSFRNSDIETYFLAMKAITDRGGWCIRMGDPTMKKILPMRNVVDYPHHPLKRDWMDLYLTSQCRFFIGCSSGPFSVANVFGVPVAIVNLTPLSAVLPFGKKDLGIPKLLRSRSDGRILTFPQVFSSALGNMRYAEEYQRVQIDVIDNAPEDIRDLVEEQLERTENRVVYAKVDEELQARFKALMKPGHYSYGSESRIGRNFIKKYAHLLA